MEVLLDVCCKGCRRFVAGGPWLPLCEVRRRLPSEAAGESSKPALVKHSGVKPIDFDVVPWALDLLGPSSWSAAGRSDGPAAPSKATEVIGDDDQEGEDCIVGAMQVMQDLHERRKAPAETCSEVEAHFRWQLRGGAWTAAHKGLSYDAFSAGPIVKGGRAEAWCLQWGVTRSASWSISVYGEEAALTLAKSWVHLHEWLYRTWLEHRSEENWSFTEEVMEQYEEPPAL